MSVMPFLVLTTAHVLVHELQRVLVAGYQQHAHPFGGTACRKRAEDVVALPPLGLHDRDRERAEEVLDHRELRLELGIGGRALDLVLRERLGTKRRLAAIERDDHGVGGEVGHHLEEHRHEAEDGVGGPAVGCGHRGRQPVERAMQKAVAVDDGDGALGHELPFGYVLGRCAAADRGTCIDSTRGA